MAVTQSPRLGITRWSAGTDVFTRAQLDADHGRLEDLVAIFASGTFNARPAAGTAGRFYYATDQARHYYDTGTEWVGVGNPLASTAASALASTAAAGTSTSAARADHVHPYPTAAQVGAAPASHTHGAADVTSGVFGIARLPVAASGTSSTTAVVRADDARLSDARTPTAHTHDDRYYTETETNNLLGGKLDKAGGTVTGDLTVGDNDTDLLKVRAVDVETHARSLAHAYTGGLLTSVTEKAGATTVRTITLDYDTEDRVSTVTEVAGGVTITTTLSYDAEGNLTGTTRSVA